MRGYDLAAWEPFFSAMIAAAAALTGLLFVAVSINLDRILKGGKFLPARAAETLATLLLVVAISALTLVPQGTRLVGLEILIIVVPMLVVTVRNQLAQRRRNPNDPLLWTISRMASTGLASHSLYHRRAVAGRGLGRRALLAGTDRLAGNRRRRLQRLGSPGGDRPLTAAADPEARDRPGHGSIRPRRRWNPRPRGRTRAHRGVP